MASERPWKSLHRRASIEELRAEDEALLSLSPQQEPDLQMVQRVIGSLNEDESAMLLNKIFSPFARAIEHSVQPNGDELQLWSSSFLSLELFQVSRPHHIPPVEVDRFLLALAAMKQEALTLNDLLFLQQRAKRLLAFRGKLPTTQPMEEILRFPPTLSCPVELRSMLEEVTQTGSSKSKSKSGVRSRTSRPSCSVRCFFVSRLPRRSYRLLLAYFSAIWWHLLRFVGQSLPSSSIRRASGTGPLHL
jgi:hypothetical protein